MSKIDRFLENEMKPYKEKGKEPSRFDLFIEKNNKNLNKDDGKDFFVDYAYVEPIYSPLEKQIKVTTYYIDVENLLYDILRKDGIDIPIFNPKDLLYYDVFISDNREIVDKYGIIQRDYCKKVNALSALAVRKNEENIKNAAYSIIIGDYKAGYSLFSVVGVHNRRKKYKEIMESVDDFIDSEYATYVEGTHAIETTKLLEDIIDGVVYVENAEILEQEMKQKRIITEDSFAKMLFEEYKSGTLH